MQWLIFNFLNSYFLIEHYNNFIFIYTKNYLIQFMKLSPDHYHLDDRRPHLDNAWRDTDRRKIHLTLY